MKPYQSCLSTGISGYLRHQACAGSGDDDSPVDGFGECTSQELSKLLVWLLVVGYQLRVLEVRLDLEATMLVSSMDEVGCSCSTYCP